jgi:hypothetical protein
MNPEDEHTEPQEPEAQQPEPPVVRKNKSRPLSGLLHQAVFVMQATEHRRLRNAETRWQLVSMAAGRNLVLGGFR